MNCHVTSSNVNSECFELKVLAATFGVVGVCCRARRWAVGGFCPSCGLGGSAPLHVPPIVTAGVPSSEVCGAAVPRGAGMARGGCTGVSGRRCILRNAGCLGKSRVALLTRNEDKMGWKVIRHQKKKKRKEAQEDFNNLSPNFLKGKIVKLLLKEKPPR